VTCHRQRRSSIYLHDSLQCSQTLARIGGDISDRPPDLAFIGRTLRQRVQQRPRPLSRAAGMRVACDPNQAGDLM
jgi:hypothetical protein